MGSSSMRWSGLSWREPEKRDRGIKNDTIVSSGEKELVSVWKAVESFLYPTSVLAFVDAYQSASSRQSSTDWIW